MIDQIENGLTIHAVYFPNGEVVKILNAEEYGAGHRPTIEFQDGTEDTVDRNDLIDLN